MMKVAPAAIEPILNESTGFAPVMKANSSLSDGTEGWANREASIAALPEVPDVHLDPRIARVEARQRLGQATPRDHMLQTDDDPALRSLGGCAHVVLGGIESAQGRNAAVQEVGACAPWRSHQRPECRCCPDVPTLAEAGAPGYEFVGWVGIAAPAATPVAIVDRLYRAIAAVESTAEAREWFAAVGAEPGVISPDSFAALVRAEYAHWGRVIRESGIRLE